MIVVGAGIGGLAAAVQLAAAGVSVTVLERAAGPGGKMRTVEVAGRVFDVGPTVLTMRWVFDELFAGAGSSFSDAVTLRPATTLARHVFADGSVLDLHADADRNRAAIRELAGEREAAGYERFVAYTARIHDTVDEAFLRSARPTVASMMKTAGRIGLGALLSIDGHRTLWTALGTFFDDPRLRMLFGRYATYAGSSPFEAPATLNVIAEVERRGVWLVEGGMSQVARALEGLALRLDVTLRYGSHVTSVVAPRGRATGVVLEDGSHLSADAIVWNGDGEALARGLAGSGVAKAVDAPKARSLSAFTFARVARVAGTELLHHTVFFSADYEAEFEDLRAGRVPHDPTVYVCAEDRDDQGSLRAAGPERLFCLVNAPAAGDRSYSSGASGEREQEANECRTRMDRVLARGGLSLTETIGEHVTTPADFHRLFPGTGGALYGPATHGMMSPFARSGATTRTPGLYLAGGSAHPGAGVPMVARSGMLAAKQILEDHASIWRSRPTGTPGGTSTR